ncbi:MAG: hypothetical protein GYA17_07930, partial [Chloroflexi bacterium]|nr:hypothetical protein [Chloroflexota bacterium]
MLRRFSINFAIFSIVLDALIIILALFVSTSLRFSFSSLPFVQEIPGPVRLPAVIYAAFPVLWTGILLLFSLYDGRRNLRFVDEFGSLTMGSALATISMAGVLYFSYRDVSRFLFLFFAALAYLTLLGWRMLYRVAFRLKLVTAIHERKVVILGAGVVGRRFEEQIRQSHAVGLKLIGFLDDDPHKRAGNNDVLGGLADVRQVVRTQAVDDVVLALPRSADARLNQVVSELHDMPVRVWVIPDYFALTLHKASIEEFAGIPMLDLRAPALSEYQRIVKRAFDLLVSLLALPVLLPLIGLVALCIWLDDRGPVFYRATRVGENGSVFQMLKFRTMIV